MGRGKGLTLQEVAQGCRSWPFLSSLAPFLTTDSGLSQGKPAIQLDCNSQQCLPLPPKYSVMSYNLHQGYHRL